MRSLLEIFKKSQKQDGLRTAEFPETYNDGIAKLNAVGSDQYRKINTQKVNYAGKTATVLTQTNQSVNVQLPKG
jgi:hypothetical protein